MPKTSAELTATTDANAAHSGSIYETWNLDAESNTVEVWDFGTSSQYPILKYCSDKDGDGVVSPHECRPLRTVSQWGSTP